MEVLALILGWENARRRVDAVVALVAILDLENACSRVDVVSF